MIVIDKSAVDSVVKPNFFIVEAPNIKEVSEDELQHDDHIQLKQPKMFHRISKFLASLQSTSNYKSPYPKNRICTSILCW
uniref:Uncharacterized protein n=1 Tax=Rhizophora mucronata TaxID=61149 RepID=A0A2P2PAR5_RHIMU